MDIDNIYGFLPSILMIMLSIYVKYSKNKNSKWIASENAWLYGLIFGIALFNLNVTVLLTTGQLIS